MFAKDQNPYSPPVGSGKGAWDDTLFWRVVKGCSVIALWFLFMDAIVLIKFFAFDAGQVGGINFWEMVKMFFLDWSI